MDGPLICPPIVIERDDGQGPDIQLMNSGDELKKSEKVTTSVSPLWEVTYALKQAVKLSLGLIPCEVSDEKEKEYHDGKDEVDEHILSGYYSMAFPHRTYPWKSKPKSSLSALSQFDDETGNKLIKKSKLKNIFQKRRANDSNSIHKELSGDIDENVVDGDYLAKGRIRNVQYIKDSETTSNFSQAEPLTSNKTKMKKQTFISSCANLSFRIPKKKQKLNRLLSQKEKKNDFEKDFTTLLTSSVLIPKAERLSDENAQNLPAEKVANIKAFYPTIFSKLRSCFGIKEDDFIRSIIKSGPFVSFQSNSKGAARAGKSLTKLCVTYPT